MRQLSDEEIQIIQERLKRGERGAAIARDYKVTRATISLIKVGKFGKRSKPLPADARTYRFEIVLDCFQDIPETVQRAFILRTSGVTLFFVILEADVPVDRFDSACKILRLAVQSKQIIAYHHSAFPLSQGIFQEQEEDTTCVSKIDLDLPMMGEDEDW